MTTVATLSLPQFPLVGTIVGSLFGAILLSILIAIVFFIIGYFCGRYRKVQGQNPVTRAPVYEDVQPHHHTEDLELKSNIAYAKPNLIIKI